MSEKFFASTADPNVQSNSYPPGFLPFQKELLSFFLRQLLSLLYAEAEVMVGNFLVETMERAAYTDQQLAEALGLTQKQVRAALEHRLMRDFVVESEQVNGSGHVWYRISPNVIIATEYRLQQTLKRLHQDLKASKETELYLCPVCKREYDLLRVISVANFRCEVCTVPDAELVAQDSRAMKTAAETKLARFKSLVVQPLLEALAPVRNMYVPRPLVVRKTVIKEQDMFMLKREAQLQEAHQLNQVPSAPGAQHHHNPLAKLETGWRPAATGSAALGGGATKDAPEWLLTRETLQKTKAELDTGAPASTSFAAQRATAKTANEGDVKQTAERLAQQTRKKEDTVVDLLMKAETRTLKKEEPEELAETVTVNVRGVPLSLREVQASEERYIEQMTEDEFLAYDALVLNLVKIKQQSHQ